MCGITGMGLQSMANREAETEWERLDILKLLPRASQFRSLKRQRADVLHVLRTYICRSQHSARPR